MDSAVWVPLACATIGAASGLIGMVIKHHLDTVKAERAAHQRLQDKVMDQAIPALEHNAAATEAMIEATKALSDRLLVWQDRETRRR
jgi:Na+/glutamate symporter